MNDAMFIAIICFPWILTVLFFGLWLNSRKMAQYWKDGCDQHIDRKNKEDNRTYPMRMKLYKDLCDIKRIAEQMEIV